MLKVSLNTPLLYPLIHFAGLGDYYLKVAYMNARIEVEDLALISTWSPEMIVQQIKLKKDQKPNSSQPWETPFTLELKI